MYGRLNVFLHELQDCIHDYHRYPDKMFKCLARKHKIIVKQTAMYGEHPTVLWLASLCKPPSLPLQEHRNEANPKKLATGNSITV